MPLADASREALERAQRAVEAASASYS
jgi:hypothetical protein